MLAVNGTALRIYLPLFYMSLALLATAALLGKVHRLTPENWQRAFTAESRWMIYFSVQDCKHCKALAPMMDQLSTAEEAVVEGLRVGKVDVTEHNGIARTFRLNRYPTILYIEGDSYWEFSDRRSIPGMLEFSRHPPPGSFLMPTELLPNVSDYRLMAEALWPPMKLALTWSVGIAFGIKLCSLGCLRLLERQSKKEKAERARRKAAATDGGDEAASEGAKNGDAKNGDAKKGGAKKDK